MTGCDKVYLYQSSLKKHYQLSHKSIYNNVMADSRVKDCGFELKPEGTELM